MKSYIQCSGCYLLQDKQYSPYYFCLGCNKKIGIQLFSSSEYKDVNFSLAKEIRKTRNEDYSTR